MSFQTARLWSMLLLCLLHVQAFAEDPKLLALLAQLLQQELGVTLAALPAAELSSSSDRRQQLRTAATDAGIAAADSWDLGEAAVSATLWWCCCCCICLQKCM
jgi:hypothetical protein